MNKQQREQLDEAIRSLDVELGDMIYFALAMLGLGQRVYKSASVKAYSAMARDYMLGCMADEADDPE